jgi:hypothetical protein
MMRSIFLLIWVSDSCFPVSIFTPTSPRSRGIKTSFIGAKVYGGSPLRSWTNVLEEKKGAIHQSILYPTFVPYCFTTQERQGVH